MNVPRICMPMFSAFRRNVFRSALYEAQDVLVECDDVDLIPLEPTARLAFRESCVRRLVYHDVSRRVSRLNPGLRPVRLTRDYELFMLVCPYWQDVWYANAIQGWRRHSRISVCWIDELWSSSLPQLQYWLPVLALFDYVVVGTSGSAPALQDALGRPCHEMSGGVDAIRFSPYPQPPPRVVDVYNVGRRWPGVHSALEAWAGRSRFYLHDTVENVANSLTADHRKHRDVYARLGTRSRFFVVAPGKMTAPGETHGQIALGFRYFEGSAAGAVLIGQRLDCAAFRRHFDWPDSVIEIQPDGSDVADILSTLSAQPQRLEEISRRNAEHALRRHDWVYRWREILELAGLKPTLAMEARQERLEALAAMARAA